MNHRLSLAVSCLAAAVLPALATSLSAQTYSFDFSNIVGSQIVFIGAAGESNDIVKFTPESGGHDFEITNSDLGLLDGLQGRIEGTFKIGATTNILGSQLQYATVSNAGTFSVDGSEGTLSGVLTWNDIFEAASPNASSGLLNVQGSVNLTNLNYTGTVTNAVSALLQSLATPASFGSTIATFQFLNPGYTLSQLKSIGTRATSYSGNASLTSDQLLVPEPSTYAAFAGAAVLGVVMLRRRR